MQFNLRTFLIVTILAGCGAGWYIMKERDKLGVELAIKHELTLENSRISQPDSMIEFRSAEKLRHVERKYGEHLRLRLRETQQDIGRFHPRFFFANDLVEKYPSEMETVARETLQKESSLDQNLRAAWILNCLLYTSPSPRDLSTSRMPSSA